MKTKCHKTNPPGSSCPDELIPSSCPPCIMTSVLEQGKTVSLSYQGDDEMGEILVYHLLGLQGEQDIFYRYSPEQIIIEREEREKEREEQKAIIEQFVEGLDEKDRDLLTLYIWKVPLGLIAQHFDRTERAIYYRWANILEKAHEFCLERVYKHEDRSNSEDTP